MNFEQSKKSLMSHTRHDSITGNKIKKQSKKMKASKKKQSKKMLKDK
jgi:hypothetical protein